MKEHSPAGVIREIVADSNHNQIWWAGRLKYSHKHFNQVHSGRKRVSVEFAVRFEKVTGMSARGLLRLQADEDLRVYLIKRSEAERDARLAKHGVH